MSVSDELRQKLLAYQKNEITEYHIYRRLARIIRSPENRRILEEIADDELRHYGEWRTYTQQDVAPDRLSIWKYYLISRVFGFTFGVKLMERGEEDAQDSYEELRAVIPEAETIIREENQHETALLQLLDEERLRYTGSMVLGLNDALVELTGALAGLTLALQDTRLVALTGSITGIAAALSMAASEYLSTKTEETAKNPVRASIYTGVAYLITVLILILPYLKGTSFMHITGPDVIRAVTHEEVTSEDLGGAMVHNAKSGVAHFAAQDEEDCIYQMRKLIGYLPQNNMEDPPFVPTEDPPDREDEALDTIVPDNPNKPYNMKDVIRRVVDEGDFYEVQEHWAQNIVVGFARLGGYSVGIVAQQPMILAGVLDIDSSTKAARFARFCDCFNIPIITFEDVPGFLPGVTQEHGGIIRNGAKLLYAYCEATVPKVTIITRKAYGGAYDVMSSKHIRGDISYAWPSAEIAVMGSEGAVNIIFRRQIAESENPEAEQARLVQEYRDTFANPYVAAGRGYIDDVIVPRETRPRLIEALQMLQNKRDTNPPKKHGNIPL